MLNIFVKIFSYLRKLLEVLRIKQYVIKGRCPMFDIKIYENENEIGTIKNLTYTQKEALERVLTTISDRIEGLRFVPEHIEMRSKQFGRRKVAYLHFDQKEGSWMRRSR